MAITAVLGPTNTGKTHYAIERMLAHRTGVIGLPLRLLAREVYDRLVKLRGPNVVALITGEERIVPDRAAFWVCTVEAMPVGIGADFVAVDEIQLCADLDRGHVFTDRLLHARGSRETLFMGAETMKPAIAALVPKVQFLKRERFSALTYTGSKKISRMQNRSAIVGFRSITSMRLQRCCAGKKAVQRWSWGRSARGRATRKLSFIKTAMLIFWWPQTPSEWGSTLM